MEESLSQQKFETNRDELFDVLKGIAIILVIIGHCHLTKLRPIIYSFHIPIFFFITGYFLKIRPLRQEITLSIKRLIIPYIFTATCICVATFIKEALNYEDSDGSLSYKAIVTHLLGFRGSVVQNVLQRTNIEKSEFSAGQKPDTGCPDFPVRVIIITESKFTRFKGDGSRRVTSKNVGRYNQCRSAWKVNRIRRSLHGASVIKNTFQR